MYNTPTNILPQNCCCYQEESLSKPKTADLYCRVVRERGWKFNSRAGSISNNADLRNILCLKFFSFEDI